MNTHKHARLTFLRRLEMVQQLIAHQVCVPEAARAYGVTAPTVRKWLGRFLAQGQAGLADASSRPTVSPRAIAPAKALAIVELRRKRLTQARIAQALGVSASTVSRVLARAGLSHLADLEPAEPVVRYEHQAPGDLLHIDIKKLGRIQRPGHRVTGNRRDTVEGAGWDFVFVAIDDHARVAFTDIHPDERFPSAVQFLKDAVAYYQRLGVTIQRLLTDNGSAFRSRAFAALCHELGIKHRFTRPYRPQTNGKAERFIQSALREWAYAHTYQNSQHRADAMKHFDPALAVPLGAQVAQAFEAGERILWQAYDSLDCPVLIVRGQDSDLLSAATAGEMLARNPRARLHEVPGVGHAPTLMTPEQIEPIARFLQE
ncbi:IS481 family transposase [Bordetella pertussis]|uniref:IS481 family transposase n=1 Tax=Bordetella pertussis TaxID=520 RepID=UPI0009B2CDA3|nr:IS481 family transposase [Bordetella pertussis]